MKIVQPIRDRNKIQQMKIELRKKGTRDYLLFVTGINTGLRISDILKFRVKDVKGKRGYNIRETKTGKQKSYDWNPALKKELDKYIETKDETETTQVAQETKDKTGEEIRNERYEKFRQMGEYKEIGRENENDIKK